MIYRSFKKYTPLLVYVAVALLAFSDSGIQTLILNTIGSHSRILRKISIFLLFLKVLGTRYTKKEFFILLPVSLLTLYNYTICGNNYWIWNILMIASLKNIDYSILFKTLFYSTFLGLVTTGLLSFLGIGGVLSITDYFGRGILETRYCFGMYHPNIWHFTLARCIVFLTLAYASKTNWRNLLLLFIINLAAYRFTASRTGFLSISCFIIIIACAKYAKPFMESRFAKIVLGGGIISLYSFYTFLVVHYIKTWSPFAIWISQTFTTGRLTQAGYYLKFHPLKLWGQRFPDDGTLFDCGFFRMFFESGWILGILFTAALLLLIICSLKNNWHEITAATIFIALYMLFETFPATRPSYCIIVFFFAILIFRQKNISSHT